ncbi:hypothetical protein FRC91_15650 [Bradymonadales bacterium TMQ1]|nr:hypothetical protein FRC91_15650 [Bradymonadales bacterium TMQ1]
MSGQSDLPGGFVSEGIVMAKVSRLSADKSAIQSYIASSVRVHGGELSERLEAKLFPRGVPAELSVEQVLYALVEVLATRYETFAELDLRVSVENAQDSRGREERDACVAALRQSVIATRGIIDAFWGSEASRSVGLAGETPERPLELLVYAQFAQLALERGLADFELILQISAPDTAELAAGLKVHADALEERLSALGLDERETQDAQNRRLLAAEDWNRHYVPVAAIVEHLFRLGDMPAHAERVRPTRRRRAGKAEAVDLEAIEDAEVLGEGGQARAGREEETEG